jgi:hypothetical protein
LVDAPRDPVALEKPMVSTTYEGYAIDAQLRRGLDGDAATTPVHTCVVTATELEDRPGRIIFARTLVLSEVDAARGNAMQPGTLPPLERLNAGLADAGLRYVQMLVDAVRRGFRDIGRAGTLTVSEARSRMGMTDRALHAREQ